MSTHTATVTEIADTARRVARTAVQVIAGFAAFAAVYVAIVQVLGHSAGISGTTAGAWLAGSAVTVTSVAAALAKIMALPAVNELLDRVNLGGQSTVAAQLDTETRLLSLSAVTAAAGTATSGD
jgi:hypothetical protein